MGDLCRHSHNFFFAYKRAKSIFDKKNIFFLSKNVFLAYFKIFCISLQQFMIPLKKEKYTQKMNSTNQRDCRVGGQTKFCSLFSFLEKKDLL